MPNLKTEPVRVELEGSPVKCQMCSHDLFHKRRSHVDTALSAGLSPEWQDNAAYCLVCDRCGYIYWFIQK